MSQFAVNDFPEFFAVAELAMVMIGGSLEDERAFSAMNFLKSNTHNRLDTHLEEYMLLKSQQPFTLIDFTSPSTRQSSNGLKNKQRYGLAGAMSKRKKI